ncbi:mechanosensitive ion channel family protein [Bifidobacterium leontopitheci]|uniref:Transporter n=1 Tax=Bifidobacterium leontopitheci TaxID=2650774 RepID=A0A6I1GDW4_9BIFI|nr:mechanosensitive ion channel family protein [Bifidobacterium leontopitheci]KAB7789840.1 transporter [Bifidobacterium leontopitheci]
MTTGTNVVDSGMAWYWYILDWLKANAGRLVFFAVVLVIALLITKGLSRLMRKVLDHSNVPSASIFINIMRVLVWVVAATIVLKPVFGIDPTTLMTALGVGGIAVSLGLKDTVANVISGFGLMLGKVIQPGDIVSVAGTTGTVKDITWRQTVVRERNGNEMVIPNSVLNTASLEKLTPVNEGLVTMTFTAKAGSDPAELTQAVKAAIAKGTVQFAQPGSKPLVKLTGFSPYGIEVEAMAFTRDGVLLSTMRDAMARAVAGCAYVEQRAAIGE